MHRAPYLRGSLKRSLSQPLQFPLSGGVAGYIYSQIKAISSLVLASDSAVHAPARPVFDNEVLQLNGVDQYVTYPNTVPNTATSIEVSGWVKPNELRNVKILFSLLHSNSDDLRLITHLASGTFRLEADDGSVDSLNTNLPIDLNQWVFIEFGILGGNLYFKGFFQDLSIATTFDFSTITDGRMAWGARAGDSSLCSETAIAGVKVKIDGVLTQHDLQGNELDASGNGNHLTLVDAPTFVIDNSHELAEADRVNAVGCGLGKTFDGVGAYATTGINGTDYTDSFTFECFIIKPSASLAQCFFGGFVGADRLFMQMSNSLISLGIGGDFTSGIITGLSHGVTYKVKFVADASTWEMFLDDVSAATGSHNGSMNPNTTLNIGSRALESGQDQYFEGSIWGVKVNGLSIPLNDTDRIVRDSDGNEIGAYIGDVSDYVLPAHATLPNVDYLGNPLTYGAAYPAPLVPTQSNAASFNGVDGYAETALNVTGSVSIEGYAYLNSATDFQVVWAKGFNTYRLSIASNTITVNQSGTSIAMPTGRSVHLRVDYRPTDATLYIDGVEVWVGSVSYADEDTEVFYVGARSNAGILGGFLNGSVYGVEVDGVSIPLNNAATGYDVASDGSLCTYVGGVTNTTQDVYHAEYELGFTKYTHASEPALHVVYQNGAPVPSPTLPAGYSHASEHPPIEGHNQGSYGFTNAITEGGDKPPAFALLPDDYYSGDATTDEYQFRTLPNGDTDRFVGFSDTPTTEEQETIDQYHE